MLRRAFDLGITHFDLANNYGPPYGSAESNFGRILAADLRPYRDELVISTKAGYDMWPGPYGEFGSRKYLLASLDQSLRRMRLDYVDIFYSHRFDPETPLEETMGALDTAVRPGKALLRRNLFLRPGAHRAGGRHPAPLGTPLLIHQPSYSMLNRWIEGGLLEVLAAEGIGCDRLFPARPGVADRPLPGRHPGGLPRAGGDYFSEAASPRRSWRVRALDAVAVRRGQTLAQMALAWVLRDPRVTSALLGASRVDQLEQNVAALDHLDFDAEELAEIDRYAQEGGINLWPPSP